MTSVKYIGMDVHTESISIAVRNSTGKIVIESVIETKASTLLQFLEGLRGDLRVTFEEGTWAAWLYDLVRPHVTEVLVCNTRKNASRNGSKSDRIDARKLSEQLYMNNIKSVYHGEHGLRTLKELARSYLTITKDLTRVMNRLPYTKDEVKRVLDACDKYPHKQNAVRLRALVMLLRYSGLRIMDAVTLSKQSIKDGVLVLRTAKTGTDVRIPLPVDAIQRLEAVKTDHYYFWSGRGTKKSCVGDYQRAFKKLYELAEVNNGHAHRWRDTFAVELLLAGVSLEQVSVLLGHQSIKVTEKHYSPWVKARQEQLEAAVRSTF